MQIKVKDTRMHTYPSTKPYQVGIPLSCTVAEGKLVLVRCTAEENARIKRDGGRYGMYAYIPTDVRGVYLKPIIISETEKIEIDDKVLTITKEIIAINAKHGADFIERNKVGNKILVLLEQFSPKQLQAIVDGKMKNGDKVLVECIEGKSWLYTDGTGKNHGEMEIKLTEGFVTLHKIVERMIPLGVAMEAAEIAYKAGYDGVDWIDGQFIKKWLEQNVT